MEVIVCLIILGIWGLFVYNTSIYPMVEQSRKRTAEKLASCISFDESNGVLSLHAFHPDIAKVVKMQRYEILHTGYQPETLTYTSVTVGNVTTGGVTKNDAYKYIKGTSKTDKYQLVYLGKEIKTIRLCSQDVKNRAVQLDLGRYMNPNGEIVVVEKTRISTAAAQAALSGYYSAMQNEMLPGYPDEAKCRKILNFVCGNQTVQEPCKTEYVQGNSEPVGFVQALNCLCEGVPVWVCNAVGLLMAVIALAVPLLWPFSVRFRDDIDMYFFIFKTVAGTLAVEAAILYALGTIKYKKNKRKK